jgi:hypothetical protein
LAAAKELEQLEKTIDVDAIPAPQPKLIAAE